MATQAVIMEQRELSETSERAYITTDDPILDPLAKVVTINFNNDGRIPWGDSKAIVHEATFNTAKANVSPDLSDAVEYRCRHHDNGPMPPGKGLITLDIPVSHFDQSLLTPTGAFQQIAIAGKFFYNDSLSSDEHNRAFCFVSVYQLTLKKLFWVSCDPTIISPSWSSLTAIPATNKTTNTSCHAVPCWCRATSAI